MAATKQQTPTYTFQNPPRAVQTRKKYREQDEDTSSGRPRNIMCDRRVVRGNTYAAQIETAAQQEALAAERVKAAKRAAKPKALTPEPPKTPPPVDNRSHAEAQTDTYLEELADKPLEETQATQTEAAYDRPSAPMFVPKPSGESKETQIGDNDLFDFDLEVEPILEVLVGKTMQQALLEVLEEEELKMLKQHQEKYEQIRVAELAEAQRLEATEKRREDEKLRRLGEEKLRLEREKELAAKIAARTYSKQYLRKVQEDAFVRLHKSGLFYDPLIKEVQAQFMPWLTEQVVERLRITQASRTVVDDLLSFALSKEQTQAQERLDALAKQQAAALAPPPAAAPAPAPAAAAPLSPAPVSPAPTSPAPTSPAPSDPAAPAPAPSDPAASPAPPPSSDPAAPSSPASPAPAPANQMIQSR